MVRRFAFTMIELIFAIVIIGISVLSLPAVISVVNKGIEENIVQEAIFAASAELMSASTGYWDERSMEDMNQSELSRVIDINGGCNYTATSSRYRLKPGHILQPYHRRCLDSNSSTGLDASINSNIYSLDDAAYSNQSLFTDYTTEASGYKKEYNASLSVTRSGDIKTLTISVSDANSGETLTVLKAQSANIGEVEFYKKAM